MSETLCAFGNGVVDILPAVPGLRVDGLERSGVLSWITVGRQDRCPAKEIVDPVNPNLIPGVDFPFGEVVLTTEYLRLEVTDHGVARGNSRSC
jgi:hypothetical protein